MNALAVIPTAPALTMNEVERVAMAIARGGLFGSKEPNAVLTLCLLAQAEGQHPAVAFRDYHIISGKPAKKAEAMLRDFLASGGKVEWHALTDEVADATFSHPSGGTLRIDWDMERAKAAQLTTPMWKKYPRQMLRSRVISEGVRSVCPSATSGLYEVDEVRDIVAERGTSAHTAPEPEVVDAEVVEDQSGTEPTISGDQIDRLILMIPAAKMSGKFLQAFGIKHLSQLPAARFDEAIERLNARMAALAKDQTNAQAAPFGELLDDEIPDFGAQA